MAELLAPAGDYTSLIAAISNGADAIYLGLETLGARAYSKNFTFEELERAIEYAHLRNVKIYVTMNTIVYENELENAFECINKAYLAGVDALIIQDLALLKHVIDNYPLMEAHASTQIGIDDIHGIRLLEKLGVRRIVLARENSISEIMKFKQKTSIELEVFIHGALCVSYSGGCLMSGLIGMRSGNRGRCAGPCRKKYKLFRGDELISDNYILSMKDLNTSDYIDELRNIDSLKIEGRMKNPEYVAGVVNLYRSLLDKKKHNSMVEKTFQRTFTKGYLFNEDKKDITNTNKPNNHGFYIGKIVGKKKNFYGIMLEDILNQNDQIRIDSKEEVNLPVIKLYDKNKNLINSASKMAYIELKENVDIDDLVYKTKDTQYLDEIKKSYPKEFNRIPLDLYVSGKSNDNLTITLSYKDDYIIVKSPLLEKAINQPLRKEVIAKQLNKLNDTPYFIRFAKYDIVEDFFLQIKDLNELRRKAIQKLNESRLIKRKPITLQTSFNKLYYDKIPPKLAVFATTHEQYKAAKELGIEFIYFDNYSRRNNPIYKEFDDYVLVGNYGGIDYYKQNIIITDHSLNAANSLSIYNLHKLGVSRVTLPHEINIKHIRSLYNSYVQKNFGPPNLEMIVYGRQELMYTKYCPLKREKQCGSCRNNQYHLNDGMYDFIIQNDDFCNTSIFNGKILNLIDNLYDLSNYINVFRLQFTIEDYEETKEVINKFKYRLSNLDNKEKFFNEKTDTKGHYNRDVL